MYLTRWNHSDINCNISFIINQTLFYSEKRWMLPLAEKRESQKGEGESSFVILGKLEYPEPDLLTQNQAEKHSQFFMNHPTPLPTSSTRLKRWCKQPSFIAPANQTGLMVQTNRG